MALTPGTRLGPYEIGPPLGAGGMGEVYRARDTRLKRDVALKILPQLWAGDADRLARFQREAEVLATLNHPHIAAIYGLEDANGISALVMELVEGEDLSQRLERGAIPLDESLGIARQMAEALEAAHDTGVIHRDLKPANIKVRPDGTVKVLDFGLAKLAERDAGAAAAGSAAHSPTITSPALMTHAGVILGTAAYMAPEQARGKPADRRSDIWAFGAIVFEMVTGRRPFTGETISDTLASVLKTDPDWHALPADLPPSIRRLVRSCLEKDPRRRLQAIGDARVQIEQTLTGATEDADAIGARAPAASRRPLLAWLVSVCLAAALVAMLLRWAPWTTSPAPATVRVTAEFGAGVSLNQGAGPGSVGSSIAISPDGTVIAFVGQADDEKASRLYVRGLDALDATALPGTENAVSPFFSPDGRTIAFAAGGMLKKVAVGGGPPVTLCPAPVFRGGSWANDDTIVFQPVRVGGLMRVSAHGGTAEPLLSLAEGEATHRWPQVLPGGKAVLFTTNVLSNAPYDSATVVVQPLPTGTRTVVQQGAFHGRYLKSGHVVYLNKGTLFARTFDVNHLTVTGPPVPMVENVTTVLDTGGAQFAVSDGGTLAYVPGPSLGGGLAIHWLDRDGRTTPMRTTLANWFYIRFAPDGQRLALQIADPQEDIWIYEWGRDLADRLTSDPGSDIYPVWHTDGERIVFASTRGDKSTLNLYWQRADRTGLERLTDSRNPQLPGSWHRNGRLLAFEEINPTTKRDVMLLRMEGSEASGWKPGQPSALMNGAFDERDPQFSPDGRWLAYVSNVNGRDEVHVASFDGVTVGKRIPIGPGSAPTWSPTRQELYYNDHSVSASIQIMVAPYVIAGDALRVEKSRLLSDGTYPGRGPSHMFDVTPDGTRFAVGMVDRQATNTRTVTLVFNFLDELRRKTGR